MSKTSKFVPLTGTVCGLALLAIDAYLNNKINENMFIAYMGFTVGGSSVYGIFKNWRKQ